MKDRFNQLVAHLIDGGFFLEEAVELLERSLIANALERTGGNRSEASRLLGIHRNTLQRKMQEYSPDKVSPPRKGPQKARPVARRRTGSR